MRGVANASPRGQPSPSPLNPTVALRMSRQAREGTRPELQLRSELHRRGLRYRLNARAHASVRSKPDILFRRFGVAVYVDGCFWHRCPIHGTLPANNGAWWLEKLSRNVARDRATDRALTGFGWTVIRVWEHQDLSLAADEIEQALRARGWSPSGGPRE